MVFASSRLHWLVYGLLACLLMMPQAAQAAGCEPHLVRSGRAAQLEPLEVSEMLRQVPGTFVHRDLGELATHLLQRDHLRDSMSAPLE